MADFVVETLKVNRKQGNNMSNVLEENNCKMESQDGWLDGAKKSFFHWERLGHEIDWCIFGKKALKVDRGRIQTSSWKGRKLPTLHVVAEHEDLFLALSGSQGSNKWNKSGVAYSHLWPLRSQLQEIPQPPWTSELARTPWGVGRDRTPACSEPRGFEYSQGGPCPKTLAYIDCRNWIEQGVLPMGGGQCDLSTPYLPASPRVIT